MSQSDIKNRKADLAWEQLYTRLEKDGLLPEVTTGKRSSTFPIRAVSWAAAIAVLCVSLATLYFVTQPKDTEPSLLTMQNNENAITLVTTLEDGSIVYLSENATLHYPEHFKQEKREVILEGNAQFDVSGNKERPFYIETGDVQVEVIGTSFQIKNEAGAPFELAVKQGEVKVTAKGNNEYCLVKAGEKVQLLTDGLLVSFIDEYDLNEGYSNRIRFKDEKLGDILNVLNKELTDIPFATIPELEDRTYTVTFADNTPEQIAEILCQALKLRCVEEDGKIVFVKM